MSPSKLLFSFGVVVAYAFALTCNYGSGGLSANLTNKTCDTNISSCYRLDWDLPNGSIYTSSYDCDLTRLCDNYTMNSNNSMVNGTGAVANLLCCNTNYCNVRRAAVHPPVLPVLVATLGLFSLRG